MVFQRTCGSGFQKLQDALKYVSWELQFVFKHLNKCQVVFDEFQGSVK